MAAYTGLKPGVNVKYAVEFRTAHRAVATARKRYEMQRKLSGFPCSVTF
jgi:hypothetical protein